MNLYSSKQKWKLLLLFLASCFVAISLVVSNSIVDKVKEKEKLRVQNWAKAIKKKVELIRLTNRTFSQLREKEKEEMTLWIEATKEISRPIEGDFFPDYSFPLKIINQNKTIPVILFDNSGKISGNVNLDFNLDSLKKQYLNKSKKELEQLFDDSLRTLAKNWQIKNESFSIEVYPGLNMTYVYDDSKNIVKLENERDSLIKSFNDEFIGKGGLVPVLLVNNEKDSIISTNISDLNLSNLNTKIEELKKQNPAIEVVFTEKQNSLLFYGVSNELTQLTYYPYIQFFAIGLIVLIAYLIFSTFRKAEQNQVWAGMAKETAHQLGTPLSSLIAWVDYLESKNVESTITDEMKLDLKRLIEVSDRFSKIGSETLLEHQELNSILKEVVTYMKTRISSKIILTYNDNAEKISTKLNKSLFIWVIENIIKNAVDSIEAEGKVSVLLTKEKKNIFIDINDNGKGILKKNFNQIFKPGFTTKKRGWGLGLSLVKRIINEYHKGQVFVLKSELNKGTTIRIVLKH